jgi:hypothetical protein
VACSGTFPCCKLYKNEVERLLELLGDILQFNTQPVFQEPLTVMRIIAEDDADLAKHIKETLGNR